MKEIVFLDASTIGAVNNLGLFNKLGNCTFYDNTNEEDVIARCNGKEIIIVNKIIITAKVMEQLPDLRLICIAATGINNIDLSYAKAHDILVKNVVDYSTNSVAQLAFSMLLHLINRTSYYDDYVKSGAYAKSDIFTHHGQPFRELKGKRLGIIGLGSIGSQVATIAEAFGMQVSYYSTSGKNNSSNYKRIELEELLGCSDVVSIHAPLNETTKGLIDYKKIQLMKSDAILLNLGRGGIVIESDLAKALDDNLIQGAGIDVHVHEPIHSDNPLLKIKDKEKIILTPHIAWASQESRELLVEKIANNIEEYTKMT